MFCVLSVLCLVCLPWSCDVLEWLRGTPVFPQNWSFIHTNISLRQNWFWLLFTALQITLLICQQQIRWQLYVTFCKQIKFSGNKTNSKWLKNVDLGIISYICLIGWKHGTCVPVNVSLLHRHTFILFCFTTRLDARLVMKTCFNCWIVSF